MRRTLPLVLALAVLLIAYVPTLQTIPNGSEHYYMIDVGETQIVLNVWGTLHATGYPLYVMTGAAAVGVLRGVGVDAALAPALVSLIWGMAALALIYVLAAHVTRRPLLAALMVIAFGLTRTVWVHGVIAEIYSMTLCILALLLLVALWRGPIAHRVYWLALIGGFGVAHHRGIAFAAPALLLAVWPELANEPKRLPRRLVGCLLLGLIGFLPYAYLPLREWAGAPWVYGEPGTLAGLWDQFSGREASRFIGAPASLDALWANLRLITGVLLTDVTLPGLLLGLVGLCIGITRRERRRAAWVMLVSAGAAYAFHVLFYSDVLSALILPVTLSLAFGWLLLAEWVLSWRLPMLGRVFVVGASAAGLALVLYADNAPFIRDLTANPTGLETIALAEDTPPGSTLMLAWGPRHFAVGFARDVRGTRGDLQLVDHKVDFRRIIAEGGTLVTPAFTFYNQPLSWWEAQLGTRVYLSSLAPSLVQIATTPLSGVRAADAPLAEGVSLAGTELTCDESQFLLHVDWLAVERPARDLSVFVHLFDANGALLDQADQSAPVYGWRPLTTWEPGEVVRDVYALHRSEDAALVRFGLYEQRADGSFRNALEQELTASCGS